MDNIEQMAREYNSKLRELDANGSSPELARSGILDTIGRTRSTSGLLEQAIEIEKQQLDILDVMLAQPQVKGRKVLSYIRSLKFDILRRLYALSKNPPLIEYRDRDRCAQANTRLIDLQIDLFMVLDRLRITTPEIDEILLLETRATAFM